MKRHELLNHLQRQRCSLEREGERHTISTTLEALATEERLVDAFVPAEKLLPAFPNAFVDELTAAQVHNGRNFPASPFRAGPPTKYVKAVTRAGSLVAIGEVVLPNLYHPVVVL